MASPTRKPNATRYWVFRGETRLGQPVAWGTTAANCLPVLQEPPSSFSIGPALVVGEPPPDVSTTLTLADPTGNLAAMVLPDRLGRQGVTGKVYVGEIEDGQATETAVTPTMYAMGNSEHKDGTTTVHLQSDSSHILGRSIALWTVEEILLGSYDPSRSAVPIERRSWSGFVGYFHDGVPQPIPWQDLLGEIRALSTENLSAVVPWIYGPALTEFTPLSSGYPRVWIEGVRTATDRPPTGTDSRYRLLSEQDGVLVPYDAFLGPMVAMRTPLVVDLPMVIDDRNKGHREVWVRFGFQPEPPGEEDPEEASRLVQVQQEIARAPGATWIDYRNPPAMIAQVIRDHAPSGGGGLHVTSFARASRDCDPTYGEACAGVFGSEGATIGEIIQHLAPLCGARVWLGTDDKLHCGLAGYTFEDQEAAKGDLLELLPGDDFPADTDNTPSLSAEIVGDPDDDSSGVARVSVEWSDLQRDIYPIEVASTIPSLGSGSDDRERERILSGAWLHPPRGRDVALAIMSGMAGDTARASLSTHLAVQGVAIHQLIRLSHPHGLALPGKGWDRRLARVEGVEVMPGEDAVRLTLADLGLSERMRLGVLDLAEEWILFVASGLQDVTIQQHDVGLLRVDGVLSYYSAPWDDGTMTIWTPGANQPSYRRSWKIVGSSGTGVVVEQGDATWVGQSSVQGSYADAVLGGGWAIMRTDKLDPDYRADFIRACDAATGEFDSGRAGFQWSAF